MCISAPVSFVASAVLLTAGVMAMGRVENRRQWLFASLPLMFSVQQFSEGIIWLSADDDALRFLQQPAVYVFLTFAEVIWPVAVPVSIMLLENDIKRKNAMAMCTGAGILFALYLIYCLFNFEFGIELRRNHIFYTQSFPDTFKTTCGIIYVINCVLCPMISSHKPVRVLGLVILASFLTTQWLFSDVLISVWCLFAALGSITVVWTISKLNSKGNNALQFV